MVFKDPILWFCSINKQLPWSLSWFEQIRVDQGFSMSQLEEILATFVYTSSTGTGLITVITCKQAGNFCFLGVQKEGEMNNDESW